MKDALCHHDADGPYFHIFDYCLKKECKSRFIESEEKRSFTLMFIWYFYFLSD